MYIDPVSFAIVPMDANQVPLYSRTTALKTKDSELEVWFSIGGWDFTDPGPTATTFSQLAASTSAQTQFFASVLEYLESYGFDGIDLDW
jgi:chitinase